ncbi:MULTISPECIES: phosphoenolpyruvate synthase [Psychrobacter]|uniref:phosphoenolpyruvate synthase n=1 Tax=Psychrobacter TaxID=497 RepID=UPI000434DCD4|nr:MULTISPECIES: phosphoenolpyruvate synthase [Psychrobacter]MBE8608488.1 phosphoenolpyruvate synthase [Pseudomonas lundensis]KRG34331.1 phosphoenolpyruvate synthase [Psychrobacter sp. P11F6]MCG3808562.1 phosphoenolpyruvate synthase [Psychrobacter sp. Ps4]MCG3873066.1 phosphoenolpyruvate synthase [Psychrobacter sp. Ps7]GAF60717.1 phosphoenolpyruvate synthase [Psychrobacter sp. JCM 18903]
MAAQSTALVINLDQLGKDDIEMVGGKNASLGEMISHLSDLGVSVPGGFATTSNAFNRFLNETGLLDKINSELKTLDVDDVKKLAETGKKIRTWIIEQELPSDLEQEVRQSFETMSGGEDIAVAVRSSATAEDLPDASFAGQQETFLNIRGIDNVLIAIKEVFASLYNDRAISYRVHKGFEHEGVALSAAVQRMVRSETGAAGVMFTLDTESGFDQVVFITSSYGLGEMVVQGAVNPDEFYISKQLLANGKPSVIRRNLGSKHKKMIYGDEGSTTKSVKTVDVEKQDRMQFSLSTEELTSLAKQAVTIEKHYGQAMDIEWAKDGDTNEIFIVQARPETVKSRQDSNVMERYIIDTTNAKVLCEGRSIGQRIGSGKVRIVSNLNEMDKVQEGDVLVSDMTDPDWEPVMKRASAIITNRGGRTCHAAIIARELGVPAIVGCGNATELLVDGQDVTASCAEGDTGFIYESQIDFEVQTNSVESMPELAFKVMMNVGNPDRAFSFTQMPNEGIGLARLEFIINRMIGVHPKALLNMNSLPREIAQAIQERIAGYASPVDFYVDKLVEGISTLAVAFMDQPVIVRMSDFKSNEYANLLGGKLYEPSEENPMLGFRGASRYVSDNFRDCFELECKALKRVRDEMGLTNVEIMIPFVRTVGEAKEVIELLEKNGLKRGENGLRVIMMCELPTNALLADEFLEHFDGFSIGSNDLTQLTLGLDRDSGIVSHLFDERDPAVKKLLTMAIDACRKANKYVGICGQGPSDHPDLAFWLMEQGISSVSLNPDSVLDTWFFLAGEEAK